MKKIIITIFTVLLMGSGVVQAAIYNIGPGDDFGNLIIVDYDTLLMTGGEGHNLDLLDWSTGTIENTSPIISEGVGGIWEIETHSYSELTILGGEINDLFGYDYSEISLFGGSLTNLVMNNESTAHISGGQIDTLTSNQSRFFDPLDEQFHGRINIYCLDWEYDSVVSLLTGTWEDSSIFNINLIDGIYDPTFDNLEFHIIPEPCSLLLFGLGRLALRKRR